MNNADIREVNLIRDEDTHMTKMTTLHSTLHTQRYISITTFVNVRIRIRYIKLYNGSPYNVMMYNAYDCVSVPMMISPYFCT